MKYFGTNCRNIETGKEVKYQNYLPVDPGSLLISVPTALKGESSPLFRYKSADAGACRVRERES